MSKLDLNGTPRFENDSENCVFVGTWGNRDLYFCPEGSYISRYGNAGHEYGSVDAPLSIDHRKRSKSDKIAMYVAIEQWAVQNGYVKAAKPELIIRTFDQRYGQKNGAFCEAINSGSRFAIVFTSPMQWDDSGEVEICVATNWHYEGDLHYALVVLDNGNVLPYPLFEEALGEVFMAEEIQALKNLVDQGEVLASQEAFCNWLEAIFYDQFAGLVESWSGDKDDRRSAIAFAARVARGPEALLEKYPTYEVMQQALERLEYETNVTRDNGHPEKPVKGVLGTLQNVFSFLADALSN